MAGQVLQGYSPGGRLYGYEYEAVLDPSGATDKKTRQPRRLGTRIATNEKQAEVVQRVFRLYDSGVGYKEIAGYLNQRQIEPPGSERQKARRPNLRPSWCPNQIRSMLRNPKYSGDWTWNKCRWMKNRRTGKRTYRERSRNEWVESIRPDLKIVPNELWISVQARFRKNDTTQQKGRRVGSKYLFTGMLRCSECGSNMIVVRKNRHDVTFACSMNWHRGPSVCSNSLKVRQSEVDDKILSSIGELLLTPDVISRVVRDVNRLIEERVAMQPADISKAREESAGIESEIDNLIDFISKNGDPSGRISDQLRAREARQEELRRRADSMESLRNSSTLGIDSAYVIKRFSNLRDLLSRDILTARARLKELVDHFVLTPVDQGGAKFFRAEGKTKLQGFLGVTDQSVTLLNSGGRI
ncbi:MAG: recombinase family protein [candidate division Zixibacteria bacterium]|nr:recombinase family protein [candidate division Zixibacteria bacterium]